MGWDRNNKLSAIIQEKVAQIVLYRLKDPRMGFVTITRAKLSKDHSQCEIYYSVLGTEGDRSATQHALDDACGHVQSEIGRTLRMRQTPHLRFIFDESIEGAIRVNNLLKELSDERAQRDPSSEPPAADAEDAGEPQPPA